MKEKHILWRLVTVILVFGMIIFPANQVGVSAQAIRFDPASPFPADSIEITVENGISATILSGGSGNAFVDAGDWLVEQQKPSGCFPWTKGDATCPSNVQGPTGRGLVQVYRQTHIATYLTQAIAAGDYYLTPPYPAHYSDGDARFATHDPLFLEELSQVSGDPKYAAFVQTFFWDKLTAGTYGETNDMDAAEFGAYVVAGRSGQGYVELSPWDLSGTAVAAHIAGETVIRDALMGAILDGLEATTTADNTFDVGGLVGAVWAAAITDTDLVPTAGRYFDAGFDSTADLAAFMASLQRASDGAWLWSTVADPDDVTNGDAQNTAYAILALDALDRSTYLSQLMKGASFVHSLQQSDGQILPYPTAPSTTGGGVETHAESLSALVTFESHPDVWIKYSGNPVVTGSMALDPYVIKDGATYKMWYTHVDNSGIWTIYYADSLDGVNWSNQQQVLAPSGSAGAYDQVRVAGPSVIYEGGSYKMWFSARDVNAVWTIGYATSPDGTTWTKTGKVLDKGVAGSWDSEMVREPSVINDGGTYKMWYAGTASWPAFKIGYATSPDGTTWTKYGTAPIFSGNALGWDGFQVYAPSVVLDGGIYHMFFSGTDNNMSQKWSTGRATSSDGITWTEADRNPILIPDGTNDSLDYAFGMNDDGTWKLWYSYGGSYAIGLATLTADTQLWLDPAIASIQNDNTTTQTFTVNIANAVDMYGYQFVITFDPANLEATAAAFVDTFFSSTMASPPGWNADIDNVNGKVYFAKSRLSPELPVSGDGPLATVTFRSKSGATAGSYKIDFSTTRIGDIDGTALPHTTQYAWLTLYSVGNLQGSVDLQGRADESGGIVTIMTAAGYTASTTISAVDGSWSFTGIPVGSYQVNIEMPRYLDAQKGASGSGVTVSAGGTTVLSKVKLLGGDANDDDIVDFADAGIIGGMFGLSGGSLTDPRADINNDGIVDILDLVLMGGNYDKVSPVPWL